ncbi:hypothetical protein GQ457_06G001740 [Hibiscus cannabinus]
MAVVIEEVNLTTNLEGRWRFYDRSHTLPGGSIVLTVTDGSERWRFECRSEGDHMYCISGSEWRRFVRPRIDAMLTLYSKEDGEDVHRVRVRVWNDWGKIDG